jgi:hypothetical protein
MLAAAFCVGLGFYRQAGWAVVNRSGIMRAFEISDRVIYAYLRLCLYRVWFAAGCDAKNE